jgi:hypothetical protein
MQIIALVIVKLMSSLSSVMISTAGYLWGAFLGLCGLGLLPQSKHNGIFSSLN